MAVYKDGDKWRVIYRYTNWNGERKQTQKRGFATKREAQTWEHEAIAERVGHESIDITYHYAHLFPSKQTEMAERLDIERMGKDGEEDV